jgi:hypothetical protein
MFLMVRAAVVVQSMAVLGVWTVQDTVAVTAPPYEVTLGAPELVLDTDGIVDSTSGLSRVQHSPVKVGQVVRQDHPWEAGLYFYGSTVQTNQVRTCGLHAAAWHQCSSCASLVTGQVVVASVRCVLHPGLCLSWMMLIAAVIHPVDCSFCREYSCGFDGV